MKTKKRNGGLNGYSAWAKAKDNRYNFELDTAITWGDIERLPKHIEGLLPEGKSECWLMPLWSAIQRSLCERCSKDLLTLDEMCAMLITITKIISSYGRKAEPKIFLGWLRKAGWYWSDHIYQISLAVKRIYEMPAKTLHEGWHLEVFIGLISKTITLASYSKNETLQAASSVGKFIFHDQNIVEMIRAVGVPKHQLQGWVKIMVLAENF